MRKILFVLQFFASAYAFADTWNGKSSDTSWYDVDKTIFHISTAAQLKGLADLVNNEMVTFEGCSVYLENDIDLNNKQWTPIGFGNSAWKGKFTGNFFGEDHFIYNMYIDTSQLPSSSLDVMTTGLFGNAFGLVSHIHLTGMIDINSTSNSYKIGGLVAYGGDLDHVSSNVSIRFNVGTSSSILVGIVAASANTISQAKSSGLIYYKDNCFSRGYFGGVAGTAKYISQCACDANIGLNVLNGGGTQSCVGGIAGNAVSVDNCIFTGTIHTYKFYSNENNFYLGGITTGDIGFGNTLNNVIFAPSSFFADIVYYFKGMIAVWAGSVTNAYYDSAYAGSSEKYGTSVTNDYLKSGSKLDGFSTDVWEFKQGSFPALKALKMKYSVSLPVENGYTSFYVEEGESATIGFTPESGWMLKAVYVNATDVTPSVKGGKLVINNVDQNYTINTVFEKDTQGIKNAKAGNRPDIKIEGNKLLFSGLPTSTKIVVYDLNGRMVKSVIASKEAFVTLGTGNYVVKVANISYKVSLK